MAATLVTGYVRLNSAHRSHDRYLKLGQRLVDIGLPGVVFYDGKPDELDATPGTVVRPASLRECWMQEAALGARSPHGDATKDTVAYCIVQHEKSRWLAEAASLGAGDLLVWVDFGIFHLAGLTEAHVVDFMARIKKHAPRDRITAPQAWPLVGRPMIDWSHPAWFLLGGVLVVPANMAEWFHSKCVRYATLQLEGSGRATWEVNTWSAIARDNPKQFSFYAADHDPSIFTGYSC